MSLTFKDTHSFLESLPDSEAVTLIGGQALNFWTELYFHDDTDFAKNYGPFTSMDIDFLSSVHGITDEEIIKFRIKVCYKNAEFYVIHPLHCVKSRIVNAITLNRNDTISLNRVKIAIEVVKKRINHLIGAERKRQALSECESVFHLACNSMLGLHLFIVYDLDIFEAVPKDHRLGEMFVMRRYPQMKQILDTKRNKKRKAI